jgi:dephospho-CoA kinase
MKKLVAFVGMPGAGKSEAVAHLVSKQIPFVRFGDITDEGVKAQGLPLTPDNERTFREKIRQELGMAAYAVKSKPKIDELLKTHDIVALDGLYSWEEYIYLKKEFDELTLIHVYAEPKVRYERLLHRPVRPVPMEKSYERDVTELEKLNKGGPIAIADYLVVNNSASIEDLHQQIDTLLARLAI